MQKQKKTGGGNRRKNPKQGSIPAPPAFNATLVLRKRLRFEASSQAASLLITGQDMFDLLCLATSTTAAYQIMTGVRLRNISIWGPMASSLNPVTAAIEYLATGSFLGQPSRIKSDTSMGSARAAYVTFAPPAKSLLENWIPYSTSSSLIALTFPANSIVDVEFDFVVQNGENPQAVGGSVAGATVGKVYCRALDSNGSSLLVPVQYPTI